MDTALLPAGGGLRRRPRHRLHHRTREHLRDVWRRAAEPHGIRTVPRDAADPVRDHVLQDCNGPCEEPRPDSLRLRPQDLLLLTGILVHDHDKHPVDVGPLGVCRPRLPGVIHPELEKHWRPPTASVRRHRAAFA